jgi:Phage derived protein Gp49-like (DUF891)
MGMGEAYRIFYVARFEEAVYVLHVFQKKTQKTSKRDIELGQKRYQEIVQLRQEQNVDKLINLLGKAGMEVKVEVISKVA